MPPQPGPEGLHSLALVDLWSRRSSDAVEHLQRAAALAPDAAAIQNDLAVALLARSQDEGNHFDLARALDAIAAAGDLAPHRPEVVFNFALLLTKLSLADSAQEHWRRFSAIEVDPGWKAEGAAHLARLEGASYLDEWVATKAGIAAGVARGDASALRAAVKDHLQPIRQWGEELVLAEWAAASAGGDAAVADAALELASQLGAAVRNQSGDSMLEEAVQAVARAGIDPLSTRSALALARGHQAFSAGLEAYRRTTSRQPSPVFPTRKPR